MIKIHKIFGKKILKRSFLLIIFNILVNCQNHQAKIEKPILNCDSWNRTYFSGEIVEIKGEWWENFEDPMLNYLIAEGMKYNHEILLNINNLEKARSLVKISSNNFHLDLEGETSRLKYSQERKDYPINNVYNIFNLNLVPSYEIDLWKRISNRKKSALAKVKFAESQAEMIKLLTASEIAKIYFKLLSLDSKQELLKKSLINNAKLSKIAESEEKLGLRNNEPYHKIKVLRKNLEQSLEEINHHIVETQTVLSILIGKDPHFILRRQHNHFKSLEKIKILPIIQNNSPSEIINQRPDIKMAEQRIISSHHDLLIAKTLYFPSLSLNSLVGFSSNNLNELFPGLTWQLGLNQKLPVFNREISAKINIAKLSKNKELLNYSHVVKQAFKELIDVLSLQEKSLNILNKSLEKKNHLEQLCKIRSSRYLAGYEDQIKFLEAQQDLIMEKLNIISFRENYLQNSVNFFKIIGGNWQINRIKKGEKYEK